MAPSHLLVLLCMSSALADPEVTPTAVPQGFSSLMMEFRVPLVSFNLERTRLVNALTSALAAPAVSMSFAAQKDVPCSAIPQDPRTVMGCCVTLRDGAWQWEKFDEGTSAQCVLLDPLIGGIHFHPGSCDEAKECECPTGSGTGGCAEWPTCSLLCAYGFKQSANGCGICECQSAPQSGRESSSLQSRRVVPQEARCTTAIVALSPAVSASQLQHFCDTLTAASNSSTTVSVVSMPGTNALICRATALLAMQPSAPSELQHSPRALLGLLGLMAIFPAALVVGLYWRSRMNVLPKPEAPCELQSVSAEVSTTPTALSQKHHQLGSGNRLLRAMNHDLQESGCP